MSHEIRTLMNAIVGFSDLLLEMSLGDTEWDFAETIRGAAHTLLTIINDILDFSKIEAGQFKLDPTPFDLRLSVEELADLLAPRAHGKTWSSPCATSREPRICWWVMPGDCGRS